MMVADFRQVGTADCSNARLKMVRKTSASWSTPDIRILLVTLSDLLSDLMLVQLNDIDLPWECQMCVSSNPVIKARKELVEGSGSLRSVEFVAV